MCPDQRPYLQPWHIWNDALTNLATWPELRVLNILNVSMSTNKCQHWPSTQGPHLSINV